MNVVASQKLIFEVVIKNVKLNKKLRNMPKCSVVPLNVLSNEKKAGGGRVDLHCHRVDIIGLESVQYR